MCKRGYGGEGADSPVPCQWVVGRQEVLSETVTSSLVSAEGSEALVGASGHLVMLEVIKTGDHRDATSRVRFK